MASSPRGNELETEASIISINGKATNIFPSGAGAGISPGSLIPRNIPFSPALYEMDGRRGEGAARSFMDVRPPLQASRRTRQPAGDPHRRHPSGQLGPGPVQRFDSAVVPPGLQQRHG